MEGQELHSVCMPRFGLELQGIPGSSPNWRVASLGGGHQGRRHISEPDHFNNGLDLSSSQAPHFPVPRRRAISPQHPHESAEPAVLGCDRAYYVRRQLHPEYRRHLAYAGPSTSAPRAEGKRPVPMPQGSPPPFEGCRQFPERKMETKGTIPEPLLPKMARYTGRARHMESENEFSLDKALSRKVRVPRDSYAQSGRAGDLSIRTGPVPRVEDESAYRQHTIDSPSFVRFCQNLPKLPEVGPHQRHHAAVQRQEAAVQQSAAEEVMRLDAWEERQQEKRTAALAAQQAVTAGKKK
ncbi:hypothetical protein WJX82_005121 [Trebouxia sp. C0006]